MEKTGRILNVGLVLTIWFAGNFGISVAQDNKGPINLYYDLPLCNLCPGDTATFSFNYINLNEKYRIYGITSKTGNSTIVNDWTNEDSVNINGSRNIIIKYSMNKNYSFNDYLEFMLEKTDTSYRITCFFELCHGYITKNQIKNGDTIKINRNNSCLSKFPIRIFIEPFTFSWDIKVKDNNGQLMKNISNDTDKTIFWTIDENNILFKDGIYKLVYTTSKDKFKFWIELINTLY